MKVGIKKDRKLPVGNLKSRRVVIDVDDCMKAYYEIMKNFKNSCNGEAYNVCGDIKEVKEMKYFTDKLIEISGLEGIQKKTDDRVYRPIDIKIQVGDTTKIKNLTGWKPKIPIDTTLKKLFDYWIKKLS